MRKRLAVAALLIGAGVAAAFAAISLRVTMTGSSELFNVTSQVLATCRGTSGITSSGTTSDSAESNLIAGSQTIAPMTRLLGPAACGANQSKAEGLVVGLDALGILGSLSSAGTAACNGTDTTDCNAEAVGMAYSTTVTTTPNHFPSYQYTFHDWRDVLGMIYGGRSNGQSSQPNDAGCNSDIRNTLANTWGNIFQKGGTCQSSSPDGCTQLQHAFRLDDGSEVSNVFAQLLGLSPTPNQAANYAFGASPFCNVNSVGVKVATATNPITITTLLAHGLSTGQVVSVVGVGVNRDMSQITGPTQSTTGNQAAIGQWTVTKIDATSFTLNNSDGTIAGNGSAVGNFAMVLLPPPPGLLADYVPTSYRELDPVRRPCANNGGPTLNLEDVCGRDNQLGLVLPIVSTDFIAGGVPAQYPSTPCGGGSNFSVRTATLVDPTSGVPVLANCPNGDTPHGGNLCVIPATGGTNPQCLAGPSDKPFVYNTNTGLSPAPGQVLGTVFNSWLLLPNRTFQHDKFGNPIIGAWYRIHQSDTIAGSGASIAGGANVNGGLGPVPAAPGFCQRPDAASQIGCLVQASPCSLGLGRSAAVNWNAPNAPNTVALKINQRLPLSQCLQTVSYPLWRKVYLNSLTGFSGASNQELAFSQCEGTASTLNAALTASGFAPLPTTAPNAGTAYCEDFNEQTLCNASANVNACATNSGTGLAYASTATTICGNGAIEAFEDCDNGLANGPVPAECSTTCRFNGVPPPPGSAPSWSSPTLTVQQATSTSVTLTVTGAPSGAAKYQIFVNGNPYALVTGSGPFTVSGLSVGTSYAFGVQASDATGLSSTNGPTQNFTDTFTCSGQANGTACTPASPAKCVTYSCQNNSCVAAPIAVDDGNQCTLDTCDPVTGVVSHHACSPIDMTVATNVTQVTQFLYAGPNPVQTGADAGALPPATSGVVRGHVYQSNLASDGGAPTPLMGVTVTVLNHPEFGSTLTHGDGMFDMAVAGGQTVRLNFALAGYLPAQRTVQVPWQNYVLANDVVLMPPDPVKNLVDLTQSAPQVVRGSPQSDVDSDGGTRTATAVIFPGTQATMTLPDGGTQTITNLTIHATEHTNKTGMTNTDVTSAMPGDLPPTSAFTYAVDLSAEEAIDAGATALTFTEAGTDAGSPVSFYVENFLNFPVGTALPVGFYDKTQGTWVPSSVPTNNGNGVVFQIVSITGTPPTANLATVDAGAADPPSTLQSNFGITPAEQQQIAALYDAGAGKTYWRAQIPHFSGVDINLGWGPPPNATGPTPPGDPTGGSGGAGGGPGPCRQNGSIIDCQDQVLGERLPIAGTPYSLAYESDRQRGRLSQLSIPISGATLPDPADLVGLEASVFVAGRLFAQNWFPPQTNLTWNFTWDGTDAYGRFVQGAQPAFVRVGAVYQGVYEKTGRFGFSANGTPISTASTSPIRQLVTIWKYWWGTLGNGTPGGIGVWDSEPEGFGGWTLNVHHRFDIGAKALRFGDGTNLTPAFEPGVINTVAGTGVFNGSSGDNGPATAAQVAPSGVTVGPDGSFYISGDHCIRRVTPNDGYIRTYAGKCGHSGFSGDDPPAPATSVLLSYPGYMAFGPDGSLYFADSNNNRIRRVDPTGTLTTVAGKGPAGVAGSYSGENGPAVQATLNQPNGVDVAPDGTLYIADQGNYRVRRVSPDGIISWVAGTGFSGGHCGCGGACTASSVDLNPNSVRVGPDGSVYIAQGAPSSNNTVCRVGTDGSIRSLTSATLQGPNDVAFGKDGAVYVAEYNGGVVRQVTTDGNIRLIAGGGGSCPGPRDQGPAASAILCSPNGVAVAPDGNLYISEHYWRVRRVAPALPGFSTNSFQFASTDGTQVYTFDPSGRHLNTVDAFTGATLYSFAYDAVGRLSTVTDVNGDSTQINRDANANLASIVAPPSSGGLTTVFAPDSNGYLASATDPASQTNLFSYDANGLMQTMTDARGGLHKFGYDSLGRLNSDIDPVDGGKTFVFDAGVTLDAGANGFTVTMTTALGKKTTYVTQSDSTGTFSRINTLPNGTSTSLSARTNGVTTTTAADGTQSTETDTPDPRYGMLSPIRSFVTTTPLGVTATRSTTRTASFDAGVLTAFTEQTYASINDAGVDAATWTRAFTAGPPMQWTTTSPQGRASAMQIDPASGRPTQISFNASPAVVPLTFFYDAHGRLQQAKQGTTRTWMKGYDSNGFINSQTDPSSHTIGRTNDAIGRPLFTTLQDLRQVGSTWDQNSNMLGITLPGGLATQPDPTRHHGFSFTPVDLTQTYTPPTISQGSPSTVYSYDADRSLLTVTRPDGLTIGFTPDPQSGRLTQISLAQGAQGTIGYNYNASTGQLSSTTTTPANETTAFTYDGFLVKAVTWSGPVSGSVGYAYNSAFRVYSQTLNTGTPLLFGYDNDALLTSAGAIAITPDSNNGRLNATALGSVTDSYTYDTNGLFASYTAKYGTNVIYAETVVSRYLDGRIHERTDTVPGTTHDWQYVYDPAGRLTQASDTIGSTSNYTYDGDDNRISYPGSTTAPTYDVQDRLLTYGNATYAYTANGELSSKTVGSQVTNYTYDVLGNLLHVGLPAPMPDGVQTVDYVIDGQNRRVGKRINGASTISTGWLYQDRLRVVAQLDGTNKVVERFVYGSRSNVPDYLVTYNTSGTALGTFRILSDHLGSPRLVVDISTGNVVETMSYDEFGNETESLSTPPAGYVAIPFGFAGGLYDPDTKLVRFGARDYDASVGRWTSKDSSRFYGGMNLYGYCAGDPINCIDRTGRNPAAAAWLLAGGEALGAGLIGVTALAAVPWALAIDQGIHLWNEAFPPIVNAAVAPWPSNTWPGDNPAAPPAEGWVWKGSGPPGSSEGSWTNPDNGESLHPDLDHPEPIGPHWDWKDPNGEKWRVNPDGTQCPK